MSRMEQRGLIDLGNRKYAWRSPPSQQANKEIAICFIQVRDEGTIACSTELKLSWLNQQDKLGNPISASQLCNLKECEHKYGCPGIFVSLTLSLRQITIV